MTCRHLLKIPGTDKCRACTAVDAWWEGFVACWRGVGLAHASAPLVQKKQMAARCRRRFSAFVREAWRVIRPGTPLVWTWYMEALCDHVQWVLQEWRRSKRDRGYRASAEFRNLAVAVPPGSGKTLLISVLAPAWFWIDNPDCSFLCLSVNPRVARDSAVECRDLIQSQWYRENFVLGVTSGQGRAAEIAPGERASGRARADGRLGVEGEALTFDAWAEAVENHPAGTSTQMWDMSEDRNSMGKFVNTRGGSRTSMGTTSNVIGTRADVLLVDDPNNPAASLDEFVKTSDLWERVFARRVNDEAIAVRIIIQQRLDDYDLVGHVLLQRARWTYLCLPLLHEVERRCQTPMPVTAANTLWLPADGVPQAGTWRDPRTVAGQVLSRRRWPDDVVFDRRMEASFNCIYQQDPSKVDNGNFKPEHWRFWVPSDVPPEKRLELALARPLGCDKLAPAAVVPVKKTGSGSYLECGKVWVTDDPTMGSQDKTASNVGLLVCAEWRDPQGNQAWLVVHDMCTGPRSPSEQRDDLDRAIYVAAKMTGAGHVRVLIENKALGKDAAENVQKHVASSHYEDLGVSCEVRSPGAGDKEDRDLAVLDPEHVKGRIYLLDGASWLDVFVKEFRRFPKGKNDRVDALAQLVAHTKQATKGWAAAFAKAAGVGLRSV